MVARPLFTGQNATGQGKTSRHHTILYNYMKTGISKELILFCNVEMTIQSKK